MRQQLITGLRVKLQKRWRRLKASTPETLRFPLRAFVDFLSTEPTVASLVAGLDAACPDAAGDANVLLAGNGGPDRRNEQHAAAIGWRVAQGLQAISVDVRQVQNITFAIGRRDHGRGPSMEPAQCFEYVITAYIEPLFDYLDEQLDDQAELLGALVRFQQWAGWFGFGAVGEVLAAEEALVATGAKRIVESEKRLQNLMFERLFADGMDLSSVAREPLSGVGRPDFNFQVHGRLIATEVKLFGRFGSTDYGKSDVRDGVRQLRDYMTQFACASGYLVVFNRDPRGLRVHTADEHHGLPFVSVGGRRIYIVVVAAVPPQAASGAPQPVALTDLDVMPPS